MFMVLPVATSYYLVARACMAMSSECYEARLNKGDLEYTVLQMATPTELQFPMPWPVLSIFGSINMHDIVL